MRPSVAFAGIFANHLLISDSRALSVLVIGSSESEGVADMAVSTSTRKAGTGGVVTVDRGKRPPGKRATPGDFAAMRADYLKGEAERKAKSYRYVCPACGHSRTAGGTHHAA